MATGGAGHTAVCWKWDGKTRTKLSEDTKSFLLWETELWQSLETVCFLAGWRSTSFWGATCWKGPGYTQAVSSWNGNLRYLTRPFPMSTLRSMLQKGCRLLAVPCPTQPFVFVPPMPAAGLSPAPKAVTSSLPWETLWKRRSFIFASSLSPWVLLLVRM